MKKVISLISSLALVISMSSCAIKETPIINGVEYKYNDQFYADTVDHLLTYIDDGDKDGVKSLLCNGLKNSDGIDADIQALIDGFEGDIIRTTEYEKDTVNASSSGKNYTSAFLSRSFYIITDKQKYGVYIAVCPIDEKHDDGEDLVGVYNISINTLDYESGDIECNTANTIEIADHNCCVASGYGDSSSYIVAQTGNKYEVIDIYRIINPQSIVKYDDITAWNSRDFPSFKEKFGAPYAESLDNDKEHVLADVYMYKISDSSKYAIVAVGRDDGSINALSVKDIDSRWSEDNKYEYILENE